MWHGAAARTCARVCTLLLCWSLVNRQCCAAQSLDLQIVTTGQELQRAVYNGVKHIVISRHLDMVQDPLWDQQYGSVYPSVPKKSMLSVAHGTQIITVRSVDLF